MQIGTSERAIRTHGFDSMQLREMGGKIYTVSDCASHFSQLNQIEPVSPVCPFGCSYLHFLGPLCLRVHAL